MSKNYKHPQEVADDVEYVKTQLPMNFRDQHPTDKAASYRAIETFAGEQAAKQEEANENDGVPERGQDG